MGTILGALIGAAGIMIVGRSFRNRDFIGVAVTMFILALAAGVAASPSIDLAERLEFSPAEIPREGYWVMAFISGMVTFIVSFVPGAIFVLLAKSAPTERSDRPRRQQRRLD